MTEDAHYHNYFKCKWVKLSNQKKKKTKTLAEWIRAYDSTIRYAQESSFRYKDKTDKVKGWRYSMQVVTK